MTRTHYTVEYIPGGYSEPLFRWASTEFEDDDLAVDQLLDETYDRGDEPIEIRRGDRWGVVVWENKGYITPEEPLL